MSNKKEMEEEVEKRTKKLRKSEERYRQLFEYSMDAAYITTPEGKVTDINQAGLELFGFSRDEFLKLSIPDLYVNPNIREKSKKILEKQGFLRDFEYKVYRKDKTQVTVRENCVAVKDEKGKIVMYHGVLKDITPQRETERKLSAIYDLSKEMTLSLDLDQISKIVLDTTRKVLNFDFCGLLLIDEEKNELYVKEFYGYSKKSKEFRAKKGFRMALDNPVGITLHVARNGESYYCPDVKKDKIYLDYGSDVMSEICVPLKIGKRVLGVMDAESTDLNAFSKEDQRLLETLASQAAIAIENARLFGEISSLKEFNETLVSSLNEGIWVEDEKGFCTYANPKMNEMLGYENLVGKHWKEIAAPEEIDRAEKETSTRPYGSASSYESILLTSNGENVPVIVSVKPLFEKGKFIGTITVFVDIREQKWAEESLKESEELYRSLSEFNEKLLENSPAGIMNIDKEMKVEYENPEMRRILGLPFGRELSAMGMDIGEVPLIEESGISSIFNELIKGKKVSKEASFVFPDGEKGYLTLRCVPLLEDSKFAGAVLIFNNITGLKRAEEALRESKNKIEQLHKIAAQMEATQSEEDVYQLIIDATKRILEFSICSVSIVDGDRLEIKATSYEEIPKDRYMAIDEGVIGRTYRTGKSYLIDDIRNDKDAKPTEEKFRSALSIPIWNVGVFIGISDKLNAFTQNDLEMAELLMSHATEALKRIQSEKTLREERDKAQKYLDVAGVLIVVLDADQKVTLIDKKGCEILGYAEKDIIGKNWTDNFVPERNRDKVKTVLKKLMVGEIELVEYNENVVLTKSGEEKIIAWYNSVLRDETGNITSILSSGEDITERKKMEEALRESEKRYKFLVDNSKEIILILSKIGKIIFANKSAIATIGYNEEEIIGKPITHFLTKGSIKKALYALSQEFLGRPQQEMEIEVKTKSGEIRTLEVAKGSTPVHEKGKSIGVLINARDITERKKAEEELRESEERFEQVVENAEEWVWETDANGLYTYASQVVKKILGYEPEELVGRKYFYDILHPDGREELKKATIGISTKKQSFVGFINRNIDKKGNTVWISTSGVPVLDKEGNLVGYRGVDVDITERKRAEQIQSVLYKITNAVNITKDLNELFRSIHNHLSTIIDTKNFYIALHDKEKELLSFLYYVDENYPERDATAVASRKPGKGLTEYVMKLGKGLLVTNKAIKEFAEKGEIETIGKLPLVWLGVPLKIDKKVVGVIAVQSYTSPTVYTEEDLKLLEFISDQIAIAIKHKQADEEKEKSGREAEFYADVLAHDIGNLDQITMGYLYLLQAAKDEKIKKKNVDGIKKSIMKSKRLAESIKTLKIIKDTKIEKFDLNESIERSIKKIKEYSDKEIEVKLDIDKHYYVKANVFLDKVFFNILENAVEFTFQDKAIIDIKTEEKKGICNIHIRDRGIGIPKNKKEDILENLETLSKRTGMGLYLTKKILERFNGKFEIKDVEKGTEIIISIPVINGGSVRNVHAQRRHKQMEGGGER